MIRQPFALAFTVFAVAPPALHAQLAVGVPRGIEEARRAIDAVRIAGPAPAIDGHIDDAAWATARVATAFTQYRPQAGAPASEQTEVRVLYDDRAIYIAFRLYDTSPDSIVGQLARRDQVVYSDWAFVGIDSYHDRRSGYLFGINPRGVRVDAFLFDDTAEDYGWDAVWDGAARTDSLGWTAEFRIPLSQLRFNADDETADAGRTWGIQFMRRIARREEDSFWSPRPRDLNAQVSVFGELKGLRGLSTPRRFEAQPYAVSRVTRAPVAAGDPFRSPTAGALSAGADLRYGLSSDFTLTATINPDFGQVEADPSVVNLTAFETFFAERRPFFLEGADIFRFPIGLGDGDMGNESLFYSRRIGRAPQGGITGTTRFRDVPEAAPILGAAKLSGKTHDGWSIGLLSAVTGREEARFVRPDGEHGSTAVEPLTHYAVGRVLRDFRRGQSAIGVVFTATHRDLADDELRFLRSGAYSAGLSARHRFGGGNYFVSGWVAGSHITGDTTAILLAQLSPARYFHRPDDGRDADASATSMSGAAGSIEVGKLGGGHWRWGLALNTRSPGFEVNDLGFMTNANQITQVAWAGYQQFRPGPVFRRWNLNLNQWASWTWDGARTGTGGNVNGGFELNNYWGGNLGINGNLAATSVTALRGGPAITRPANANVWFNFYSDRRRTLGGSLNGHAWTEPESDSHSWSVSPSLRFRASSRMELSLGPRLAHSLSGWQWVTQRTVDGEPVYVFGTLDQRTLSLTTRLNYTFTPDLSLQLYAQPFISAGAYARFMEVADPRGATHADRFHAYAADRVRLDADAGRYTVDRSGDGSPDLAFGRPDFNVRQLRANAVLRWEYNSGSTLFLVWSHDRSGFDPRGDFRPARDSRELWRLPATNVLLLKVSYWLGL
jgi:hypothetical protein